MMTRIQKGAGAAGQVVSRQVAHVLVLQAIPSTGPDSSAPPPRTTGRHAAGPGARPR